MAPIQAIAKLFNGERTVAEVFAEAQISEARGLAIVRKLTSLGVIRTVRTTVTALPRSQARNGFSELEEAFFAAEVAPIDECDLPFQSWTDRIRDAIGGLIHRDSLA